MRGRRQPARKYRKTHGALAGKKGNERQAHFVCALAVAKMGGSSLYHKPRGRCHSGSAARIGWLWLRPRIYFPPWTRLCGTFRARKKIFTVIAEGISAAAGVLARMPSLANMAKAKKKKTSGTRTQAELKARTKSTADSPWNARSNQSETGAAILAGW